MERGKRVKVSRERERYRDDRKSRKNGRRIDIYIQLKHRGREKDCLVRKRKMRVYRGREIGRQPDESKEQERERNRERKCKQRKYKMWKYRGGKKQKINVGSKQKEKN